MPDYFVQLAAFDEVHAEVALIIALTDLVNGNNAWVLKAGRSLSFPAKALQMRFRGPSSQTNYFERDDAIETFLMSAINNTLAAAANFLQQLVVAKLGQRFCCPLSVSLARQRRWTSSIVILNLE